MEFFQKGVDVLKTVTIMLGAGVLVWGVVNLFDGYSRDDPGSKSQGMKQFMAGAGIIAVAVLLIPELKSLLQL